MRTVSEALLAIVFAVLLAWSGAALAQGRLTSLAALSGIQVGVTTAAQVRELLGPPARTLRFPSRGIEALEYDASEYGEMLVISIAVGIGDGKVQNITRSRLHGP